MKRKNSITIAIPASMVSGLNNLRDKTIVLGQLGRAAAIYRVDQIIIFEDQPNESLLMKYILGYLETPQYLRKNLFNKRPELRYAGTLPPLKTPHHKTEEKLFQVKVGNFREGIVIGGSGFNYLVDIGLDELLNIRGKPPAKGTRVITEILQIEPKLSGRNVKKKNIPEYWGYDLRGSRGKLSDLVDNPEWDLTIGTSKTGRKFSFISERLEIDWANAKKTLIVFGSYKEGVYEIILREGRIAEEMFDYIINTIPEQGTETVRTEEAVISTLAVLNIFKD
jgi:predicted SPOUT superfamily RNA methylase MTH1